MMKNNRFIALLAAVALAAGCGVRGDPQPPERPAELSRGRPNYRRATERVQMQTLPVEKPKEDDSEKVEGAE